MSSNVPSSSQALAVFRYGRFGPIFLAIFVLTLLATAGFVVYLGSTLPEDVLGEAVSFDFRGTDVNGVTGRSLFWGSAAFLVLLAIIMSLVLMSVIKRRRGHFELHPEGIVRQSGAERLYTRFADIGDLYLFASGQTAVAGLINNFAYRVEGGDWIKASFELKGFQDLLLEMRKRHVEHRCPPMHARIGNGERVIFRYIDGAQFLKKRVIGNFMRMKTQELSLSGEGLSVDGKLWPYAQLQALDQNDWIERLAIKASDGTTVFSCFGPALLSTDVFIEIFEDLRVAAMGAPR